MRSSPFPNQGLDAFCGAVPDDCEAMPRLKLKELLYRAALERRVLDCVQNVVNGDKDEVAKFVNMFQKLMPLQAEEWRACKTSSDGMSLDPRAPIVNAFIPSSSKAQTFN